MRKKYKNGLTVTEKGKETFRKQVRHSDLDAKELFWKAALIIKIQ